MYFDTSKLERYYIFNSHDEERRLPMWAKWYTVGPQVYISTWPGVWVVNSSFLWVALLYNCMVFLLHFVISPVYTRMEDDDPWLLSATTTSEFLEAALTYEAIWQLKYSVEEYHWLTDEEFPLLKGAVAAVGGDWGIPFLGNYSFIGIPPPPGWT